MFPPSAYGNGAPTSSKGNLNALNSDINKYNSHTNPTIFGNMNNYALDDNEIDKDSTNDNSSSGGNKKKNKAGKGTKRKSKSKCDDNFIVREGEEGYDEGDEDFIEEDYSPIGDDDDEDGSVGIGNDGDYRENAPKKGKKSKEKASKNSRKKKKTNDGGVVDLTNA
jgi:hypothetical protein